MEVNGNSAMADLKATQCLEHASKDWQLLSPMTTITWFLEQWELTTGEVTMWLCLYMLFIFIRGFNFCTWISFFNPNFSHHFVLLNLGIARLEQNNSTFLDMGIFDDGPYEVGNEKVRNPDFVPVPANSYLGELNTHRYFFFRHLFDVSSLISSSKREWAKTIM